MKNDDRRRLLLRRDNGITITGTSYEDKDGSPFEQIREVMIKSCIK